MACLLSWLQREDYYKVTNIIEEGSRSKAIQPNVNEGRIRFTSRSQLQSMFSCSYSPIFDSKDDETLILSKNLNKEITRNIYDPRRVYKLSYSKRREINSKGFPVTINLVDNIECVNSREVLITVISLQSKNARYNTLTLKDKFIEVSNPVVAKNKYISSPGIYTVTWTWSSGTNLIVTPI